MCFTRFALKTLQKRFENERKRIKNELLWCDKQKRGKMCVILSTSIDRCRRRMCARLRIKKKENVFRVLRVESRQKRGVTNGIKNGGVFPEMFLD